MPTSVEMVSDRYPGASAGSEDIRSLSRGAPRGRRLSTGSRELDALTGGAEHGPFHLFYGSEVPPLTSCCSGYSSMP